MPQSIRETGSGAAFTVGGQLVPQPVRWRTFAGSLGLHLLAVLTALALDRSTAGEPYSPPTVAEAAAAEGLKITWYRPEELLPAVAPAAAVDGPPRPEAQDRFKLKQRIEAASPEADSLRQMIVNGPPEIRIERDIETANMLALAPIVERQRFELRSRPREARKPHALPALDAPRIDVRAAYGELAAMRELERLRYLPAEEEQPEPARAALEAVRAPDIESAAPAARLAALGIVAPLRYEPGAATNARPERQAVAAAPPDVQAQAVQGVDLTAFQRMRQLRYMAAESRAAAPSRGALPVASEAPQISGAAGAGIDTAVFQHVSPLRYAIGGGVEDAGASRAAVVRKAIGEVAGDPAAPDIRAGLPSGHPAGPAGAGAAPSSFQRIARLRFEQWGADGNGQAPGRRAVGTVGAATAPPQQLLGRPPPASSGIPYGLGQTAVSGPALAGGGLPPPPGGGGTAERNLVVVGVNPGERIPQEIPRGQRAGSFSGGPEQGDGSGGGGTQTARLHVPNLTIGGRPRTEAAIAAGPAGSAVEDLQRLAAFRSPSALRPLRAAAAGAAEKPEEIDPDRPFRGRPSYSLAINMPNITSASGSWELQFAEIGRETERGKLAAPVPRVKVDPRYIREAVEEKIEGEVILHGIIQPDGAMDKLQVIRGLDDRLDAGALAALSKWRFDPARKYGRPVAVEAVVRIPFRLTPPAVRR